MCLVNFHIHEHPMYQLIVVANRDEFYKRPTAKAHFWEDYPNILAGRDLMQKGSWLGISKEGRFAALTNYRDPRLSEIGRVSRGDIVKEFLAGDISAAEYAQKLSKQRRDYAGFNVVVSDGTDFYHYNNIYDEINKIPLGTHSISNHTLNTPWPKVVKGRERLAQLVESHQQYIELDALFNIVFDEERAPDYLLPKTGVTLEWERLLSSLFIKSPEYGTRSTTVILVDRQGAVTFVEKSFEKGEFESENAFTFHIEC